MLSSSASSGDIRDENAMVAPRSITKNSVLRRKGEVHLNIRDVPESLPLWQRSAGRAQLGPASSGGPLPKRKALGNISNILPSASQHTPLELGKSTATKSAVSTHKEEEYDVADMVCSRLPDEDVFESALKLADEASRKMFLKPKNAYKHQMRERCDLISASDAVFDFDEERELFLDLLSEVDFARASPPNIKLSEDEERAIFQDDDDQSRG